MSNQLILQPSFASFRVSSGPWVPLCLADWNQTVVEDPSNGYYTGDRTNGGNVIKWTPYPLGNTNTVLDG
jgi:hypothetical protein